MPARRSAACSWSTRASSGARGSRTASSWRSRTGSRVAEFDEQDQWPRRWAEEYVARARDEVGGWLKRYGVRFFPVVNWAERGVYGDGNSVPRFHLAWGVGRRSSTRSGGRSSATRALPSGGALRSRASPSCCIDGGAVTGCQDRRPRRMAAPGGTRPSDDRRGRSRGDRGRRGRRQPRASSGASGRPSSASRPRRS